MYVPIVLYILLLFYTFLWIMHRNLLIHFSVNWDSLHARLNYHYKSELQEKETQRLKYTGNLLRKNPQLILDLKPFRS